MQFVLNKSHLTPRLRILLVMPDANIHRLNMGVIKISFREAPLTLTTLAALVPPDLNADITLIDESVDTIPGNKIFDLVGISCLTGTANRAYQLADTFRAQGSTVILGGVHVSLRPQEAALHAECIVIGFAESTWPELLRDFAAGNLRKIYRQEDFSLKDLPPPRRDLQRRFAYTMPQTVFATRGCHCNCDFCAVPAVPFGWHTRPIADVINEIRNLPHKRFAFNDVNLISDRDYAMELFSALAPLGKKWGGLATVSLADDHDLLDCMSKSGCQYLLLGFESVNQSALGQISKGFNKANDYRRAMESFHNRGIVIQGCFIFGIDNDSHDVFSETVAAVHDLQIDIPRFAIYTPYPGTKAFANLKAQGRILHENWEEYDTQHVVFEPLRMSPDELYQGFRRAYRDAFSAKACLTRTFQSPHPVISFLGNSAYQLYVRKLWRGPAACRSKSAPVLSVPCLQTQKTDHTSIRAGRERL